MGSLLACCTYSDLLEYSFAKARVALDGSSDAWKGKIYGFLV